MPTTVLETLALLVLVRLVRRAMAAGVRGRTIGLVFAILALGLATFGWVAAERLPPPPVEAPHRALEGRGVVFEVQCERVDSQAVELTLVLPDAGRRVVRLAGPGEGVGPGADACPD